MNRIHKTLLIMFVRNIYPIYFVKSLYSYEYILKSYMLFAHDYVDQISVSYLCDPIKLHCHIHIYVQYTYIRTYLI